jgi:hypothetical protein
MTEAAITRRQDEAASRGTFDLTRDGTRIGYLSYSLTGDATMTIDDVEVDPALRGKGLGEQLVAAAVEWARANEHRAVPLCSYARAVMGRTTE